MIVIRENTQINGYVVSHHNYHKLSITGTTSLTDALNGANPIKHIVSDWNLAQDCVLIDGAIVDHQFLEKTPVGLFCKSKRMAEFVQELIEAKDMK